MWKLVGFCLVLAAASAKVADQEANTNSLKSPSDVRKHIFLNYDSKTIPSTSVVPVSVALNPLSIIELDEENEVLVLDTWMYMAWVDNRLQWNPSDFSGIKVLILPSTEFWRPDITTYTASPVTTLMPKVFTNVILNHTGGVIWVPPVTVSSRCSLQYRDYPHDIQRCNIRLGAWTLGSKSIDLQLYADTVPLEHFQNTNKQWRLQEATVDREDKTYPCCPNESYAYIDYNLTLHRRPVNSLCVSSTVSVVATCLGMLMFFLPADSTQKFVLGALAEVLLGIVSMFLNMTIQAPGAKFYATDRVYPYMIAVAVFLLFEVITVNVARMAGPCRPPRCLLSASRLFCQPLESCAAARAYDEIEGEKAKNSEKAQQEWKSVATALDRVLLFAALAVSVLLFKVI